MDDSFRTVRAPFRKSNWVAGDVQGEERLHPGPAAPLRRRVHPSGGGDELCALSHSLCKHVVGQVSAESRRSGAQRGTTTPWRGGDSSRKGSCASASSLSSWSTRRAAGPQPPLTGPERASAASSSAAEFRTASGSRCGCRPRCTSSRCGSAAGSGARCGSPCAPGAGSAATWAWPGAPTRPLCSTNCASALATPIAQRRGEGAGSSSW